MAENVDIFSLLGQSNKIPFELTRRNIQLGGRPTNFYDKYFRKGFVFHQYSSLQEVFQLIDEYRKNSSNLSSIQRRALDKVSSSKYSDYNTFMDFAEQENQDKRQAKKVTENILDNVENFINLGGLFKKDRLKISQDDRGIFDFSLASLGLYRPIEFYSEKLEKDINNKIIDNPFPNNPFGLVNPDNVIKIGNDFVYKKNKKKYYCEKRQKGATRVFNKFFEICELRPNKEGLQITYEIGSDKVFNGKGDVRLKYASSNKKSYLIFDKKDDNVKYVDIFMSLNNLLYTSDAGRVLSFIPAYLIAGSLEKYGIKVRISAMRLGANDGVHSTIAVPVKDYNENTRESFNKSFAILTTKDLVKELFGFLKILAENDSQQITPTGNTFVKYYQVGYDDRNYINLMMQRYKNWVEKNKDKPFVNSKVNNPNFQFGLNADEMSNYYGNKVTKNFLVREIHNIFFKYYYYMDFLALEMIPMLEFVKSIYTRFINDKEFKSLFDVPLDSSDLKQLLREYVRDMLVEKYQVVKKGKYADTKEQEREKDNKFQSKLTALNEALNSVV